MEKKYALARGAAPAAVPESQPDPVVRFCLRTELISDCLRMIVFDCKHVGNGWRRVFELSHALSVPKKNLNLQKTDFEKMLINFEIPVLR